MHVKCQPEVVERNGEWGRGGNANFVKVEETENIVIRWTVILKSIADQWNWVGGISP